LREEAHNFQVEEEESLLSERHLELQLGDTKELSPLLKCLHSRGMGEIWKGRKEREVHFLRGVKRCRGRGLGRRARERESGRVGCESMSERLFDFNRGGERVCEFETSNYLSVIPTAKK
jgi:hypothetical protein